MTRIGRDPSGGSRSAVVGAGARAVRAGRRAVHRVRRATSAEGAGDSGLSRLFELHAVNAAGDAAVAIALAGTLFFQVPTGEARSQVALFLGLTMLPFAIVAPLVGPFLDRFRHGRRWAVGATMATRAFLCWVLGTAVVTDSTWLFPAALGVLVASKAYGVTKAAAVPRLLPPGVPLVRANGRMSLAGVVGVALSAPLAFGASLLGPEWALRYGFVLFVVATVLAVLLDPRVDSDREREPLALPAATSDRTGRTRPLPGRRWFDVPPSVLHALRANCGPRWLSGFLTMFMAFLLREHPIDGWSGEVLLAVVVGAAGAGNTAGIALASLLRRVDPARTVVLTVVAGIAATLLAAVAYGLVSLVVLGLTAGLAQSLAKLSLDSTIQRDVHERVRTSTFARSDTTLQLAWVVGGFVGIAIPLEPRLGLGLASVVLTACLVLVAATGRRALVLGRP